MPAKSPTHITPGPNRLWIREVFPDGTSRWVQEFDSPEYPDPNGTVSGGRLVHFRALHGPDRWAQEFQSLNPEGGMYRVRLVHASNPGAPVEDVDPHGTADGIQMQDFGVDRQVSARPTRRAHPTSRNIASTGRSTDFFKNMGAVATLGASVTFVLIAVELQDPLSVSRTHYFTTSTVHIFLSISWLLFMITLGCSFFLGWMGSNHAAVVMYILILSAIFFSSLVVAAYVEWVGFFAVALSGLLVPLTVGILLLQFCDCSKDSMFAEFGLAGILTAWGSDSE
ncbi:uncharacterized protein N7477_002993 [Penicillium maclennaniae]|uniref:uncharacterized protein n=1 Tax=Penicillium maclennaniae TaxID=1343394 RepID=UPI0025406E4E|nr:uncharacterized protein N7477_002993 [Penicillium maclennaniae]KAJ5677360.1 hypothetical protein N7477_002993 [Penicillium maclennaniae]